MDDAGPDPLPRQLLLLCDGTNNNLTGGRKDTNVVKLSELLAACPDAQRVVHYDPGVGNAGELPGATAWDQLRRKLDRLNGLAFGRGVYENMAECYLFLMRHYRPGDQLFIFGFSRGAFTARSVAGLVNQFGILRSHMEGMLPTLLHVYFADRSDKATFDAIAQQVSRQFADPATRHVDIHFIGVWDTVASVGLPPFDAQFTALPRPENKRFVHVRQALALDEHRTQFKPRLYARDNGPFPTLSGREGSLRQLWFPGAHCDVGGGYEVADSALSDRAFAWLVAEAVQVGLRLAHQGEPLDSEDRAERALHQVHAAPPRRRPVLAHSEMRDTALWAVTGMCVRDTNRVVMDDGQAMAVRPEEHPSVAARRLNAAQQPLARARTPGAVWLALVLATLLFLALGQLLLGPPDTGSMAGDTAEALRAIPGYVAANGRFQLWQLTGWLSDAFPGSVLREPLALASWANTDWTAAAAAFDAPRWALVWDFALIAFYAIFLSWFAAVAFFRLAGLRRGGDRARPLLNLLGWALPVAVFADVGENLCTWLAWTLGLADVTLVALALHIGAALCALLKLAGLAGTAVLIAWGLMHPRARHGRQPAQTVRPGE